MVISSFSSSLKKAFQDPEVGFAAQQAFYGPVEGDQFSCVVHKLVNMSDRGIEPTERNP